MSNIEQNLQNILTSRYGKDVRQSIHDSIHDCYEDGKAGAVDLIAREQIANLVSMNNPTEGNSELQDIRVGFDGTVYESAGEAVREQCRTLSDTLNVNIDLGELQPDMYINSNTGSPVSRTPGEGSYNVTDFIPCESVFSVEFTLSFPNDISGIAFYDVNKKYIVGYKLSDFPDKKSGDIAVIEDLPIDVRWVRTTVHKTYIDKSYIKYTNITRMAKHINDNIDELAILQEIISPINNVFSGIFYSGTDFSKNVLEIRTGYFSSDGAFVDTTRTHPSWKTVIFPIYEKEEYMLTVQRCITNANHAFLNDQKKSIQLILIKHGNEFAEGVTVTSPENAKYFALQYNNDSDYSFVNINEITDENINTRLSKLENNIKNIGEILEAKDYSPINIPYLFQVINNGLYSREYIPRVFPESFLDFVPEKPITVNYRRDAAIDRQKKTTAIFETQTKPVILRGDGYKEKTVNIKLHCLNENVFNNKNIRLCMFGVSFDSINYLDPRGNIEDGGTMTINLLEKYFQMGKKDNEHTGNFVSVGSLYNPGNIMYKDEEINIYGCHEARGGHCGVNYLRQPMNFSPTNVNYDPNVSGTFATGDIMWYMCGLRYRNPYNVAYSTSGTDYGEYERTKEKTDALRCTPFGKYHHDYSESLWEFCNKKGWIRSVYRTYSAWTGSDDQKNTIDLCMDYVCENPEYPFYDVQTARATSYSGGTPKNVNDNTQYAFNFNKLLERYRTMDDLGVRLSSDSPNPSGESVQGSDGKQYKIGTNITTQNHLSKINMCIPTHILWDMAYNDWIFYVNNTGQSDGTDSLALAELFMTAIKSQLGDGIIFGLKAKKRNGSFFPELWGDIALSQTYTPTGYLVNYNKLLIQKYSDLTKKASYIPIFAVSIPYASNFLQEQEDFVYGKCLVNSGDSHSITSDITHEGLASAKAMTYQIYGWLAYTIK